MKRIPVVIIASYLLLSSSWFSISWGQAKTRSSAVAEAASLEGTVVDATTRQPITGAVILAKNQTGKVSAQQRVGPDGAFQFNLDPKQTYLITASADGYDPFEERLAFTSSYTNRLYGKTISLARTGAKTPAPTTTVRASNSTAATSATTPPPAPTSERVTPPKTLDAKVTYTPPLIVEPVGKTTQLRAIQFVQSKAELLPDAQPALEQLLAFLSSHPTAEIELAGHTDNQGDFDENLRLSKQRVDLVKDYLVKNGIAANRITTRGYGPTRPIASNKNEATRQLNRRVEMTIVKQ
ncbi:OmpA family protein [Spirosoma taeanense]|uniref:OmpA family protein n=1 Tax=Spirosoma taeanense TaxID=2735870 RepID=A0A6M5Y7T3_9BACT|nr:OmpA family protein [Spirosoma taeanense]QJW89183.1 OmpA family protein [Spirosoma taeanense]